MKPLSGRIQRLNTLAVMGEVAVWITTSTAEEYAEVVVSNSSEALSRKEMMVVVLFSDLKRASC